MKVDKAVDKKVLRADASPLNEKRFQVTLECGHEPWVTAARKPKVGSRVTCMQCSHDRDS